MAVAQRRFEVVGLTTTHPLLLRKMTVTEELGRLFACEVDLSCKDGAIDFEKVLGQNVTIHAEFPDGGARDFNAHVTRFAQVGWAGGLVEYRATLRPWLWFLTRARDCRIFQHKSVPDIVKAIFREHGFSDFKEMLGGSYSPREYCTQYRETDFDFVSRLMEREGIYYYFTHERGKHTLVLSDSYSSHERLPDHGTIRFYPPSDKPLRERHISGWSVAKRVLSGAYALDDFDFTKPRANLGAKASVGHGHARDDYEVYDYPGKYHKADQGEGHCRTRLEELHTQYERAEAKGDVYGVAAGGLFELAGYPRKDQNREYLILSATHTLEEAPHETGSRSAGPTYKCRFTVAAAKQPFRSARATAQPRVQGPQTAIVVGKAGEEIWTDEYGRVKVRFHWDRVEVDSQGKAIPDENRSCWVRVAQLWAGKTWGGIHLPRVGQEVVVEFLEGDPDRPIITGRVYNDDCKPPYDLPAQASQSGIKSRSTKGGTAENANEIRFEDKLGEEQLLIHAEKDQTIEVEKDETHWVGQDRTKTVDRDETTQIHGKRTESVDGDEDVTVRGVRTVQVDGDDSLTVGGSLVVEATNDLTLRCGQAQIVLRSSGDVEIDGTNVTVKGTVAATVEGSASAEVSSSGVLTVKGSLVQIN